MRNLVIISLFLGLSGCSGDFDARRMGRAMQGAGAGLQNIQQPVQTAPAAQAPQNLRCASTWSSGHQGRTNELNCRGVQ